MQTSLAKKFFAVGSAAAMILASVPMASAAVHPAGTNVVSNGTVYWINASGQKQAYTSAGAFLSYGFNSWSNVVAASAEDLALPSGPFVPPMDGSLINDNGTVYLMTNGMRAGFTSAANFTGLGYSFANVIDGDTSFLVSAPNINTTAMAHSVGTLVNQSGTVYLMTTAGKMGIPSLSVFNSWGYSFSKVVPANSYDAAIGMNSGIMQARVAGQLNPTGTVVVTPPSGSVSVGISSDNPASRAVVSTEGQADLAHFTFMGSGVVTNVVLKRLGVSADTSLTNVYLFDGATRITDASSVSSGSLINFNNTGGLFTVNGSKTLSVRADMAAIAGETVGIQLVSAMTGSTAVSGTPVSGNLHNIAVATLAGVVMSSATGSGATDPGPDINVWQGTATVSTRDVLLTRLALRNIGSIVPTDIKNFKLFVDGTQVATTANLDVNGYVTFNMSKAMQTGARILKVTADVIGGSGRTVQMSLRGAYDISSTDTQYNAGVTATGTFPFGPAAFTVNAGSMTVVKTADSQSTNVTVGTSDQSLAKYTFTAYGEAIKVDTLRVGMITTGGTVTDHTIRNVRILVNGSQVGSNTSVPAAASFAAASGTSFTTNFTVFPGSPATVEIRGDIFDNEGADNFVTATIATALQALLVGGTATSNATPQVSLGTINVPSQANVLGNVLTVSTGTISVAQTSNYGAQTVAVPATAYKIGSYQLIGNSTEAVNLNTIYVGFTAGSTVTEATDLSDLYVVYGGTMSPVKGTVSSTILNGNSWSVNRTLGVNETIQVDVFATLAASVSTNAIITTLAVAGVTTGSGTTVYADSVADTVLDAGFTGQTITGGTGTFTVSVDASTPDSTLVDDSGTITSAAFKFAAVTDSFTITDITLTLPAGGITAISQVNIQENGVTIAGGSKSPAATMTFNGLSIPVAANTSKVLTVQLVMSTVVVGAGTTGSSLLTTLTTATGRSSGGTSAALTESPANPAGNVMYVYKAIPTISLVALPTSLLGTGTQTVSRFSINTNGTGTVAWKQVKLTIAKTGGAAAGGLGDPVLASFTLWDADTSTQITAASVIVSTDGDGAGADLTTDCTELDTACTVLLTVGTDADDNVEKQISGAKTYEVRATVTGNLIAGDNVNTSIARPSAHIASAVFTTAETSAPSFVWSDVSDAIHDTGTTDWTNDNNVKNLPTNTQTLTK